MDTVRTGECVHLLVAVPNYVLMLTKKYSLLVASQQQARFHHHARLPGDMTL